MAAYVCLAAPLFAQQQVPPPPDILQIYIDPVKPGKMAEYKRVENEAAIACSGANTWPYMTLQAISGPQEEWFVSGFDTYAAMERSTEPFVRNVVLAGELSRIMESRSNLVLIREPCFCAIVKTWGRTADSCVRKRAFLPQPWCMWSRGTSTTMKKASAYCAVCASWCRGIR